MYKATISYPYANGWRIYKTFSARTRIIAWLKAKMSSYCNSKFFKINVETV